MTAVVAVGGGPDLAVPRAETIADALTSGGELVWLVAPGGTPAPGALELLRETLGAARLATGLVVDAEGRPADRFVPRGKQRDIDLLAAAAPARRLPVRFALAGNTLFRAAAADGPPDPRYGPYAMQEWTARLLGGELGWLVPASVVTLPEGAPGTLPRAGGPRDAAAVLRMLRTGVWTQGEAMRAVAALRPGRASSRPGRRGPSAA